MYIRCWGSRGSLSASGAQYLKYGGDTSCMEVRSSRGDIVIIDAGTGIRGLGNKLAREKPRKIDMIFTHAHWDHIFGFPFFTPLYMKGIDITIRGCSFEGSSYKEILRGFMSPPYFPVGFEVFGARVKFGTINSRSFSVGEMKITPIPLSHPNFGVGFRIEEQGKSFVFLTDNELSFTHEQGRTFDDYAEFSQGADLLIHDAEFTKKEYKLYKEFGHSHYVEATRLAVKAGVKRFGMFHHNRNRSDDEIDEMVTQARKIAQKENAPLDCFAVGSSFEIQL
ncbi:MAG: MBL fold metallo-hydrolase [Chitinivibrionales bacterium]|nr:MBL fold metallo-hydrolase [Chitinivibrionales bacterium]